MKKTTTGLAGSVLIQQLKLDDLTRAEKHGKRLDKSSQSRAIYKNAPPLTTTGLDLNKLYRQHIADAFVPKAKAKAMHVIVQFPVDLVDGEDAAFMLHHARTYVEKVFGTESIFADRVDRDEKGRHLVDIIIAPKYTKRTKHTEKKAVTMSVHLKELAKSYGRKTNVHETGRALQDAFFDYLRNEMGLEEAKRGSPKLIPGPDWKASEELRSEELDGLKGQTEKNLVQRRRCVAKLKMHDAKREEVESGQARGEGKGSEAQHLREILDHEMEELREAEKKHKIEAAKLAAQQLEIDRLLSDARAEADRIRAEATANAQKERMEAEVEAQRNDARLTLLERAVDDTNGLDLRPTENGFTMNGSEMSRSERVLFDHPWPSALSRIGRELALMMERIRKFWNDLKDDKAKLEVDQRELAHKAHRLRDREAGLEARSAELVAGAARQLEREQELNRMEATLSKQTHSIAGRQAALDVKILAVEKTSLRDREWLEIATKLQTREFYIEWSEPRELRDDRTDRLVEGPLAERFATGRGPEWFERAAQASKMMEDIAAEVGIARGRVAERERELAELVGDGGSIVVAASQSYGRRSRSEGEGRPRNCGRAPAAA